MCRRLRKRMTEERTFIECVLGGGGMDSRKRAECEKIGSLVEVKKDLLAGISDLLATVVLNASSRWLCVPLL